MEHKYINIDKLRDYNCNVSIDSVVNDLVNKYKIKNIADDEESLYCIADALYSDIINQRANYKAYIEKGMDARVLMELRKSALIPMSEELFDFYKGHSELSTVEDIKEYRKQYLKFLCDEYEDLNWQYYYMIVHYLKYKAQDLAIDFEECYEDGDWSKQTTIRQYCIDFTNARLKAFLPHLALY